MTHPSQSPIDLQSSRREYVRWIILLALNSAGHLGAHEELIHSTISPLFPDMTTLELRRELNYLALRKLLTLTEQTNPKCWFAKLTREGIDMVDYTIDCEPGIARPAHKYW